MELAKGFPTVTGMVATSAVAFAVRLKEIQKGSDVCLHLRVEPFRARQFQDEGVIALSAAIGVGRTQIVGDGVNQAVVSPATVYHVAVRASAQDVIARAATKEVVAYPTAQDVVTLSPEQQIVPCTAAERVSARATEEHIVSRPAAKRVASIAAIEQIPARTAIDRVVAILAEQKIVAALALDVVVAAAPQDRIAVTGPDQSVISICRLISAMAVMILAITGFGVFLVVESLVPGHVKPPLEAPQWRPPNLVFKRREKVFWLRN